MGWLDKLLGRDKQDEGGAAAAPASVEESAPEAVEDDPHAGHDHPPGEHPHDELT
jgi:hypothetical protein